MAKFLDWLKIFDFQTVLIMTGGVITLGFVMFYPRPLNIPDPTTTYHISNVVTPLCEGEPLQYDVYQEIHDLTFFRNFTFVVVDREIGETVSSVGIQLENGTVREAGEHILLKTQTREIYPPLPAGDYSARFIAWSDGSSRPGYFSFDFEVQECN